MKRNVDLNEDQEHHEKVSRLLHEVGECEDDNKEEEKRTRSEMTMEILDRVSSNFDTVQEGGL